MHALTYSDPFYDLKSQTYLFYLFLISCVSSLLANFNSNENLPEVVLPDGTPRPSRHEIEERSAAAMDRLFGGDEEPPSSPPPKKDRDEEPEDEEPEDEEPEDEEPEGEDDNTGDFDYEEEIEGKRNTDEEDPGGEDTDEGGRETKAQKDAKINGRRAKKLENELTEAKLLVTRQAEELQAAKERLEAFDKVTIDPRSTPEYKSLNDAMWEDVDAAVAEELPRSAASLADAPKFNALMAAYLKAVRLPGPDRANAIQEIKSKIVADLGGFTDPYDELLDDDRAAADTLSRDVLAVLRRNKDKAESLIKLETELRNKAKVGKLAFGFKEYDRARSTLEPLVANLGKLEDKLIDENPYAPEAVVAHLAKSDPALQRKLDNAKSDVLEVVLGERPLSEKEYNTLEEQGVDIREFLKERTRKFNEKRAKLIPLLVRGLFATGITKKALESIAREQRDKQDQKDELEALGAVERRRNKKPVKPTEKSTEKILARERPLAIDSYLDSDE